MQGTINRRNFLRHAGIGCLAIAGLSQRDVSGQDMLRPNIVWIYSDDHAQAAVSAYGSRLAKIAPTPNIDRIANQGMRFNNSFVTNSLCGPCRAVILTGKHSHINGFRKNGDKFNPQQQTFPKLLQGNGYQTAVFGKWHLGTKPVGFDAWEILPGQGHYYNPDFITAEGRKRDHGYVSDLITDKALRWLDEERETDKPFMLMVQHKAPHREWEPGPDHLTTFDDVEIPEPDNLFDDYANRGSAAKLQDMSIEKTMTMDSDLKVWPKNIEDPKIKRKWKRTLGRMDEKQRAAWNAAYDPKNEAFRKANLSGKALVRWKYQRYMKDYLRCVRSVDDNVGRVLDYLKEKGLDRNTIVFYSSDQSFYLGEHGWFDKRFMYEESLRTPLLAMGPGIIPEGSTCEAMVQNLDMAETFLELTGAEVPGDMQGASLVALLKGKEPSTWRNAIYYHYYEGEGKVHNVYVHYGVRTQRYKLIHFYTLGEWEFYDLKTDPAEMHNEIDNPKYASDIQRLHKKLTQLRKQYQVPEDPA